MSATCHSPVAELRNRLREAEERILEWAEANAEPFSADALRTALQKARKSYRDYVRFDIEDAEEILTAFERLAPLLTEWKKEQMWSRCGAQRGIALRAFLLVLGATCAMGTVIWCMSHNLLAAVAMALAYGAGVAWLWRRGSVRDRGAL